MVSLAMGDWTVLMLAIDPRFTWFQKLSKVCGFLVRFSQLFGSFAWISAVVGTFP